MKVVLRAVLLAFAGLLLAMSPVLANEHPYTGTGSIQAIDADGNPAQAHYWETLGSGENTGWIWVADITSAVRRWSAGPAPWGGGLNLQGIPTGVTNVSCDPFQPTTWNTLPLTEDACWNYYVDPQATRPGTVGFNMPPTITVDGEVQVFDRWSVTDAVVDGKCRTGDVGLQLNGEALGNSPRTTAGPEFRVWTDYNQDVGMDADIRAYYARVSPDTSPPLLTVPVTLDCTVVEQGEPLVATFSCEEPGGLGSGLVSCVGEDRSGPVMSGASLDTSVVGRHAFTVTGTDAAGNTRSRTIDYTIVEGPATSLTGSSVQSGLPPAASVGYLLTTGDPAAAWTYALVPGTGSTDNADFAIDGVTLRTAAVLEGGGARSIRIRSTNAQDESFDQVFEIAVHAGLYEPELLDDAIAENLPAGSVVGGVVNGYVIQQGDYTLGDWSLVAGAGDTDNDAFALVDDGGIMTLQTTRPLDFEAQPTYSVRMQWHLDDDRQGTSVYTIQATDANDAPTAVELSNTSVLENLPAGTAIGPVSAIDQDDWDTVAFELVSGLGDTDNTLFAIDGMTLRTGAPLNREAGATRSIRIRATDGAGAWVEGQFTIEVDDVDEAPRPANDAYTTAEDVALDVDPLRNLLTNDLDEGGPLTVTLAGGPDVGTVTVGQDGTFAFTPLADYHGPDSFAYRVCDSADQCANAVAFLTITPVNDAPIVNGDALYMVEDGSITVPAPGLRTLGSDVEGGPLTAHVVTPPDWWLVDEFILAEDGGFTFRPSADVFGPVPFTFGLCDPQGACGSAVLEVRIDGTPDAPRPQRIDDNTFEDTPYTADLALLGGDPDGDSLTFSITDGVDEGTLAIDGSILTYTPDPNWFGSEIFAYQACDPGGLCAVAQGDLFIGPVNDAPVAADDSANVPEDGGLVLPAPGVLANDTDVESNALTATVVSGPSHATSFALGADGSWSYEPVDDFAGTDGFTYRACDLPLSCDEATVTIAVTGRNDAPVALDDEASTTEDVPVEIDVLDNDSDIDGDDLVVTAITSPTHGSGVILANGAVRYTPTPEYSGPDAFEYTVSDGLVSTTAQVSIDVSRVNDRPVADDDSYEVPEGGLLEVAAPGIIDGDTDAEDDLLQTILAGGSGSSPQHAAEFTLGLDGGFRYRPQPGFIGTDAFYYLVGDGFGNPDLGMVSITVTEVNEAPTASDDAYATNEDQALSVVAPGVLGDDSDPDGDGLSAVLVAGPSHGTLALASDGGFTYTPAADYSGPDSFTYRASDGEAESAIATVGIDVASVNDRPSIVVSGGACTSDNDPRGSVALRVMDVETGANALVLTLTRTNPRLLPANGLRLTGTGGDRTLSVAAADKLAGSGLVTITVTDGAGGSAHVAVNVIAGTNGRDTLTGVEGSDLVFGLTGDDRLDGGAVGDPAVDVLCGGGGNDLLRGRHGADVLYGHGGIDILEGGAGDDDLRGGSGSDVLRGEGGGDTLRGEAGGDSFSGGAGADVYVDLLPAQGDVAIDPAP